MKKKALFLDRDGVINRERGEYTFKISDFEFIPGLFNTLRKVADLGYEIIVITNQGGIAKGLYTHQDVAKLHEYMMQQFTLEGIVIRDIFYSPYHPNYTKSLGRKPGSLLFEKALAMHHLSAANSFMIGDSERDIIACEQVGIPGFLIAPNSSIDFILDHL